MATNISKKECYDAINKGKKVIENNSESSTFLLIMYKGEAYYVDLYANTDFRCFKILWQWLLRMVRSQWVR